MDKDFLELINSYPDLINSEIDSRAESVFCECFCVSIKEIRDCILSNGLNSFEQAQAFISFGIGCGLCLKNRNVLRIDNPKDNH